MALTLNGSGTITGLAEGGIEDAKILPADLKANSGSAGSGTFYRGDGAWAAPAGVTLSAGVDDRVVTAGGADTLNAESNLTYATNLTITNGHLKVSNGYGIDFYNYGTGTDIDSNILDDYEEGEFEMQVQNGWGITSPGYSHQTFRYTKVGRLVTCHGKLELNSGSENSNQIYITGLPFPVANWANEHYPMAQGFFNSCDADGQHFAGMVAPNSTYLYFYKQTATGLSNVNGDDVGDTFDLRFTLTYQT